MTVSVRSSLPCEGAWVSGTNLTVIGIPTGHVPYRFDPGGHFGSIRGNAGYHAGLFLSMIPRASVVIDAGGNVLVQFYVQEFTQYGWTGQGQFDWSGLPECTALEHGGTWKKAPINQRPGGIKFTRYIPAAGDVKDLVDVVTPPGEDVGWKLGGVF